MRVKGNKVDLCPKTGKQAAEVFYVLVPVVLPLDEDIFKGNHPPVRQRKLPARGYQAFQRIFFVHGHQGIPGFIVRGIQGNCQVDRNVLTQFLHLRHKSTG